MAEVIVVSVKVLDGSGSPSKTIPFYFLATTTDAALDAWIAEVIPDLDDAIDGKIDSINVTRPHTLPAGLKASAVAGSDAQRGALLNFDAANTNYSFSIWVSTWEDAGFSGDNVDNQGIYSAFIGDCVSGGTNGLNMTDRYGNDLTAYNSGKKTFRK